MKAVSYCRVSTEDQAERGYSLEAQEKDCKKFAANMGYTLDKAFIERGESAKTQNRTELLKMLEYLLKSRGKIQAVIVWKLDRLTRSTADYHSLVATFSKLGIKLLSVTESNEETPTGDFLREMFAALAQLDNRQKGERTKRSMMEAVKAGRWCWRAPFGYKNVRDHLNRGAIEPSKNGVFVEEMFRLAEKGVYKQTEIVSRIKQMGCAVIDKNYLSRILKSPVYAGLIRVSWQSEPIDGIHKSIISKDTYFRVQAILEGKRPSLVPKVRSNPHFPLRNFVRCHVCGLKLTGSFSTGRNRVRYPFYHCRSGKCRISVKKAVLEAAFYKRLETLQAKPHIIRFFEVAVLGVWRKKQDGRTADLLKFEKELKELQSKKDRILELMIRGTLDDETYKQKSQEIQNEIIVKRLQANETEMDLNKVEACLDWGKTVLSTAAKFWEASDLDLKQRFQQLVFPEGLTCEKGGLLGTAPISPIFKLLQDLSDDKSKMATLVNLNWNHILHELENFHKLKDLASFSEGRVNHALSSNHPQQSPPLTLEPQA